MTPTQWAAQAVKLHGWSHALSVAHTARAGGALTVFWDNVLGWLKNRAPKDTMEEFFRTVHAREAAKVTAELIKQVSQ